MLALTKPLSRSVPRLLDVQAEAESLSGQRYPVHAAASCRADLIAWSTAMTNGLTWPSLEFALASTLRGRLPCTQDGSGKIISHMLHLMCLCRVGSVSALLMRAEHCTLNPNSTRCRSRLDSEPLAASAHSWECCCAGSPFAPRKANQHRSGGHPPQQLKPVLASCST